MSYDLVVRNGMIVDGTGAPAYEADVAVKDGVIVEVGQDVSSAGAARVIDAEGKHVSPGFIDVHAHYDAQVMWDPAILPQTTHGYTTVLCGNCGFGLAPVTPNTAEYLVPMLSKVEGIPPETLEAGIDISWRTMGEMLDRIEGKTAVNIGFMTGHSALRAMVMGERANRDKATSEEIDEMKRLLRESIEQGSLGFSSSVAETHRDHKTDPVPSLVATPDELLQLASVVKDFEGTQLGFATTVGLITEEHQQFLADLSLSGGRPVNWPVLFEAAWDDESLEIMLSTADVARAQGAEVRVQALSAPALTYHSFSGQIGYDSLPSPWNDLWRLPVPERAAKFRDPAIREALYQVAEVTRQSKDPIRKICTFQDFILVGVVAPQNQQYLGRRIGDIAAERGKNSFDTLVEIALDDDLGTVWRLPMGNAPLKKEGPEEWARIVKCTLDNRTIWAGDDGGAHTDVMALYDHGTKLIRHGVRDFGLLSIEQAVREMTLVPALFTGLRDRGILAQGKRADIVVFDYDAVDYSPVEKRFDLPGGAWRYISQGVGYEHVIVNGVPIMQDGQYVGTTPGTVLRPGRDTYTVDMASVSSLS